MTAVVIIALVVPQLGPQFILVLLRISVNPPAPFDPPVSINSLVIILPTILAYIGLLPPPVPLVLFYIGVLISIFKLTEPASPPIFRVHTLKIDC